MFLPAAKPPLNGSLLVAHDLLEEHDRLVGLGEEGDVSVGVVDGALHDGVVRPHRGEGDVNLRPVVQGGHLKMVRKYHAVPLGLTNTNTMDTLLRFTISWYSVFK